MSERKKVSRFEELEVWKEGCDLAVEIYKLSKKESLQGITLSRIR